MNDFENSLKRCPPPQKAALIEVADSAEMALLWFRDHKIVPTGADLMAFASLVINATCYGSDDGMSH